MFKIKGIKGLLDDYTQSFVDNKIKEENAILAELEDIN